ncbi:MAG: ECF transporter S component [Oscillospiraceae bacterium]|nr:ECF transporter S component [Oscillospiraceae bacterium]
MAQTNKTKTIATMGMLCAIAYVLMYVTRPIPNIVAFPPLGYDPKDIIILLGGFLYGPLHALLISVVVSLLEMVTVSTTGIIGCAMNIVSTGAFVCTASFIYRKRKTLGGAVIGLTVGVIMVTIVMTLWNYILTPFFISNENFPVAAAREAVVKMLLPIFIPFNLFKSGINAVLAMMMFKPVTLALCKANLIEPAIIGKRSTKIKWIFIAVMLAMSVALLLHFIL